MRNKTVIILNDYCHINGGASKVAIDEAVGLAASGARVIFIGACGPICAELENAPLEVICLGQKEMLNAGKNPFVMLQGLWNFKAARVLRKVLSGRHCEPQAKQSSLLSYCSGLPRRASALLAMTTGMDKDNTIIHLHGYTKALTTSPVRVAHNMGFKIVCTLHDFFPACPNGAFFDYVKVAPCPKRGLSMDCIKTQCDKRHYVHKIYRVVRGFVQKYIGGFPGNIKYYTTLSNKSVELLKPYLPSDAEFFPLENPIPIEKREPVNVCDNKSVVAVGRLDAEKGIEILLESAEKAGVSLTLVGDGPLRELAEKYDFCRVTGWVKPAQVVAELEKARVLAFPSLWYEAYGLVVAEAAAKGVPAIVSDICAASERIVTGVNGWVFKSGDVESLAAALSVTNDNEAIAKAGQGAYESFWKTPPVLDSHIENLLRIYDKILERM